MSLLHRSSTVHCDECGANYTVTADVNIETLTYCPFCGTDVMVAVYDAAELDSYNARDDEDVDTDWDDADSD